MCILCQNAGPWISGSYPRRKGMRIISTGPQNHFVIKDEDYGFENSNKKALPYLRPLAEGKPQQRRFTPSRESI
jgi:hypothetical protein